MRMSGETDACNRRVKICAAMACGVAILLAETGAPQAFAGTILGHAAALATSLEGDMVIPVASSLSFSVRDIEAEPGKEAPIAIIVPSPEELRDAGAEGAFVLIRNIPEGVSFSEGMATGRIWVVPLREATKLRLISRPGMNARFRVGFHLIGPGNRVLAEDTVSVAVGPRETVAAITAPPPRAEVPTAALPQVDLPKKPVQSQTQAAALPTQEEAILLERGREVLKQGSIAAARLIFEELARRGSAVGALALARSYDPAHLPSAAASVLAPNMAVALKWYKRAAQLGNPDAKRRLAEIVPGG
jgi:hypothetical protein